MFLFDRLAARGDNDALNAMSVIVSSYLRLAVVIVTVCAVLASGGVFAGGNVCLRVEDVRAQNRVEEGRRPLSCRNADMPVQVL